MKDLIINIRKNLLAVLRQIDRNGKRTVFVVDDNEKFVGVITDGDIRRLILSEKPLNTTIVEIIGDKVSLSAKYGDDYSEIIRNMNTKINIVPLLNDSHKVIDYLEFKKEFHAPIASTELNGNELAYVIECVSTNWISSQGRFVKIFEENFAEYIGVQCGVAVTSGTAALHLALAALGIGPGDEVIVPDLTFAATINAVLYIGATPVLVDVEDGSWCIDPAMIEKAITSKTKAIIPVHLYGYPCDMAKIMGIAEQHSLFVIEDCAQAHGAEFGGAKVGSFGQINCFSFFANKIITTGEGGMCLTNDLELDRKIRILRDHGMRPGKRYWHDVVGYNYRMTNLQAAIGVAQLERIDQILQKRENIRHWYHERLSDSKVLNCQIPLPNRKTVTWLVSFVITDRSQDRQMIINKAMNSNIIIRPLISALSSMPLYACYSSRSLINSEKIAKQGLSLPTVIRLTEDEYAFICRELKKIINDKDNN